MTYYARTQYTGNGSQTAYTFNWDTTNGHYMATSDVYATLDGTSTSAFTVAGNTLTFTSAPGSGVAITIYRKTSLAIIEQFTRLGTPSSGGFNNIMRRLQYIGQELLDIGGATMDSAYSALLASQWATLTTGLVAATDYSSKEYAQGTQAYTGGSSKNWAQQTGADVTGAAANSRSAKSWAQDVNTGATLGGSSKDWAQTTGGTVNGTSYSSKEHAVGTTVNTGSAKDWATKVSAIVASTDYSAKEYAQGTQASTGGSAKNWAQQTGADVTGASANSRSAKSWAQENLAGATLGGSAKDWAQSASKPDGTSESAKTYAAQSQSSATAASNSAAAAAATAAGLSNKGSCKAATTANLNATYVNGTSGVGATLTNAGSLAAFSIDGVSPSAGARILVKNQTTAAQNGIYTLTTAGSGSVAWVLTRVTDYDESAEIIEGTFTVAESGTTNSGTLWIMTTSGTVTVGTTGVSFTNLVLAPGLSGLTSKGDLLTYTGSAYTILPVGAGLKCLVPDTTQASGLAYATRREVLTATRTYYVRTDGNDSNTGLANNAGGAFLTIQKAIDTVADTIDNGGNAVTIQIGDGTYTGAITLRNFEGRGAVTIVGNTGTPTNVVVSVTSNSAISLSGIYSPYILSSFQIKTTTSGFGINASNSSLSFTGLDFGACVSAHILADAGSYIVATGNYTVSGGATAHLHCNNSSIIDVHGRTVTSSGSFSFGTAYAYANYLSNIQIWSMTFTGGTITGTRYNVNQGSLVFTNGGGASYLPGNAAGSTATNGQYL